MAATQLNDASGHHRKSSTVGYRRLGQFGQQRLSLLQVARIGAFGEPPVNGSEQFARLLHLALVAPEAGEAQCGFFLVGSLARFQSLDDLVQFFQRLCVFGAHRLLILAAGIGPLQCAEHGPRHRDRSATMVLFTN